MRKLLLAFCLTLPLWCADSYPFTSFCRNGETGVFWVEGPSAVKMGSEWAKRRDARLP